MNPEPSSSSRAASARTDRLACALEFLQRAHAFQREDRLEAAMICCKKSLEIHPTPEAHLLLALVHSVHGRYQDAIHACERAIQLDPEFGNPYNDIGGYLIKLGQIEEAIPWFEMAIAAKRYDTRAYPHYNLGRVYEHLGKWRDACLAYERALRADPAYVLADRALNYVRGLSN